MAHELIQDVHQCRHDWKVALDEPFDADKLAKIKERYDRALRADKVYHRLYTEQNAAFLAELHAARECRREQLEQYRTKRALCAYLGRPEDTASTRAQLIEWELSKITVESAHDRVKRLWAGMTDAERCAA